MKGPASNYRVGGRQALLIGPGDRPATRPDALQFARARLGFEPDAIQAEILKGRKRRLLLNCTRQWGKSTITALKAVWHATSHPGSLTVVLAPTERQVGEFILKAKEFLRILSLPIRGDGVNKQSVRLPNGSRIVGLSDVPATVRGYSKVSLLIVEEAAQVNEAAYFAIRAMLVTNDGDLWLLSTPFGKRGFFYNEWTRNAHLWERVMVPATECSRIPAAALDEERLVIGDEMFRQEYMCEFVSGEAGVFDRDLIDEAFTDEILEVGW